MPQSHPKNPFQPAAGATPPVLAGREAELVSIADATRRLASGSPPIVVAIVGLRGLGKTALLSEFARRLDAERTAILRLEVERDQSLGASIRARIERQRAASESFPKRIGAALDRALSHLPSITYELPDHAGSVALAASAPAKPDPSSSLGEAIGLYNEALHERKQHLAILIDEVQDADLASLGAIAAAVHQSAATEAPILLAVAGLPQAETLFKRIRTYTQRWDHLFLSFLTRAEVIGAIRIPILDAGADIDDEAVDRLEMECGGYPYFVQRFASEAWNCHTNRRITLADVERSIPAVRAKIDKIFYRDTLDRLTTREVAFVIALADCGSGAQPLAEVARRLGVASERLGSVRTNLIKKDVVISPGPRLLEFRIPLFDRYVRDHRDEIDAEAVRGYRVELAGEGNS